MKYISLTLLLVGTSLNLCSGQIDCFGEGLPRGPKTKAVAKGADDFAITLFKKITSQFPLNSLILSPYSIWSVLNLAYFGSAGITENELREVLGVPSKSDAFYGSKILQAKLQLNQGTTFNKADKAYFSQDMSVARCAIEKLPEIEKVDFKDSARTVEKINNDVSVATEGKIQRFLSANAIRNARFVLINAVYFKGNWTSPFITGRTTVKDFYNEGRQNKIGNATMMVAEAKFKFVDSRELDAGIIELPYENSDISMTVILPNDGQTVNGVLSRLTSNSLDLAISQMTVRSSIVLLPRFKMTTRVGSQLKDVLGDVGINSLFNPTSSDLSFFIPNEPAFVSDTLHHATIEVTEEGTVAAASTALIGTRSGPADVVVMNMEKPFIFLIRDNIQGLTLFSGVFRDPDHTLKF